MELEEQIKTLLEGELPGASAQVERDEETGKIGGHIIWDGFEGYNSLKRQNRIFGLLRRNLNASQLQANLSYIFTYTPAEYAQQEAA